MAARRTNAKMTTRQTTRITLYVSFVNSETQQPIRRDMKRENTEQGVVEYCNEETVMLNMMKELHRLKAKAVATRSAALTNQIDGLYSAARNRGEELVRGGATVVEEAKARLADLHAQEVPFEKHLKDAMPVFSSHDESLKSLLAVYPTFVEDLFPRRADRVNDASAMLESNPPRRSRSRKCLLKSARARFDEVVERERIATDATALIKHYEALLLS